MTISAISYPLSLGGVGGSSFGTFKWVCGFNLFSLMSDSFYTYIFYLCVFFSAVSLGYFCSFSNQILFLMTLRCSLYFLNNMSLSTIFSGEYFLLVSVLSSCLSSFWKIEILLFYLLYRSQASHLRHSRRNSVVLKLTFVLLIYFETIFVKKVRSLL